MALIIIITQKPQIPWFFNFLPRKVVFVVSRVEIYHDRHDRRSCKICASCVNFPRKQRDFSHYLRRATKFTHAECDFALKLLKFYTLSLINSNKKLTKIADINAFTLFLF